MQDKERTATCFGRGPYPVVRAVERFDPAQHAECSAVYSAARLTREAREHARAVCPSARSVTWVLLIEGPNDRMAVRQVVTYFDRDGEPRSLTVAL
jgi:hypothetical protein